VFESQYRKKDLITEFELIGNNYKVSVSTIDVLLDILPSQIDGYEAKE
jgi:hypothetical protein